ncbi:MAG TPA: class I SAM-dependent methyltransferase [Vicinamibacteria bacterium]|nr:class I SAM-dependent methyltransferase [Vicinamibacteria bacterium]
MGPAPPADLPSLEALLREAEHLVRAPVSPQDARVDLDDPRIVSVFDDLPLWSAPFALRLLERVRLRPRMCVLDLGCGAGFPLVELAERLGPTCCAVGVDPWLSGLRRARGKAVWREVAQAHLVCGVGEALPLADASVDLVVSNNGLNNVRDVSVTLAEVRRVTRPGAQLVATMNLPETMAAFYAAFEATLVELGQPERIETLRRHVHEKRKPVALTRASLAAAGFAVESETFDAFDWRFLDARALFAHSFIRLGFLEPWQAVVPEQDRAGAFALLGARLDRLAAERGELRLGIPFVCFDCRRL